MNGLMIGAPPRPALSRAEEEGWCMHMTHDRRRASLEVRDQSSEYTFTAFVTSRSQCETCNAPSEFATAALDCLLLITKDTGEFDPAPSAWA